MMEYTMRGLMQYHKKLLATHMYKSRNVDHRVGNHFEGPQLNDLVRTCNYNDTATNNDNDSEIHRNAQALSDIIQAEALQEDVTGNNLSTAAQNAIHVADMLTAVMESNNVPELSNVRALPTIPNDIVMTFQENQPQNVLASLRLPPPPPPPLLPVNQPPPQPLLQPQTTDHNEELLPLAEEHMTQVCHEPPDGLNHTQQVVYRIFSEYVTYESRKRQNLL